MTAVPDAESVTPTYVLDYDIRYNLKWIASGANGHVFEARVI
jgi:hypothetical protein